MKRFTRIDQAHHFHVTDRSVLQIRCFPNFTIFILLFNKTKNKSGCFDVFTVLMSAVTGVSSICYN